jgi:lysophospholipase L1-like esterase
MAKLRSFSTLAALLIAAAGSSAVALAACSSPTTSPPTSTPVVDGAAPDGAVEPDGGPAADTGATDSGPIFTKESGVLVLGRVDISAVTDMKSMAGAKMSWPGAQISVRFKGTEIKANLRDQAITQAALEDYGQLLVIVDNVVTKTLRLKGTMLDVVLATGLEDKEHEVALFRKTEASVSTTTFEGFSIKPEDMLPIARPTRKIEFIGDSITVGYGTDVIGPYDSTFPGYPGAVPAGPANAKCPKLITVNPDPRTEVQKVADFKIINDSTNAYNAYPAIVARTLNAEAHVLAWSGKGLSRNADTADPLKIMDVYQRGVATQSSSTWDNSKWSADAVVINLGTNDFANKSDPGAIFGLKYEDLLKAVRTNHPNAIIFSMVGPMLENFPTNGVNPKEKTLAYIKAAVDARRAAGDTKVKDAIDVTQNLNGNLGCEFHPYKDVQLDLGNTISGELRLGVPGWR